MYFFIQVNENSVLQVQIQTNIQEIGQTKALELSSCIPANFYFIVVLTWTVKAKNRRISVGLSDCRTIVLLDCRTNGLSEQRTIGLSDCRTSGLSG